MIDTSKLSVQVRANARLIDAKRKQVEQCPIEQQVEVCAVLILDYNWSLEQIPESLKQDVSLIIR